MPSPRQLALLALRSIDQGAYADIALDRLLQQAQLGAADRRLVTELVYGSVRRRRTLDALIDQLATKTSRLPTDLRLILQLGLYQLRYLSQIPASAAVNTAVELAKQNKFAGLSGLVNGLLRQYVRLASQGDPLQLPTDPIARLALQHSYPDWIVATWLQEFGPAETEQLCEWFNQPPHLELRINPLKTDRATVLAALQAEGTAAQPDEILPQGLRLGAGAGSIQQLPGFAAGWWTVQDRSAQLVSHLLEPQPGETIIDACAAPGGKTTHIAELMQDQGIVWGCDRYASRLKKLQANVARLGIESIRIRAGDSRSFTEFTDQADRVLLDAPCSGLGTLHRHADARWRQTPETVLELAQLQQELLAHTATWVKPGGVLVYSTCTLHPAENEAVVESFLQHQPDWQIDPPSANHPAAAFVNSKGWLKILPHQQDMDGFFMVRLRRSIA